MTSRKLMPMTVSRWFINFRRAANFSHTCLRSLPIRALLLPAITSWPSGARFWSRISIREYAGAIACPGNANARSNAMAKPRRDRGASTSKARGPGAALPNPFRAIPRPASDRRAECSGAGFAGGIREIAAAVPPRTAKRDGFVLRPHPAGSFADLRHNNVRLDRRTSAHSQDGLQPSRLAGDDNARASVARARFSGAVLRHPREYPEADADGELGSTGSASARNRPGTGPSDHHGHRDAGGVGARVQAGNASHLPQQSGRAGATLQREWNSLRTSHKNPYHRRDAGATRQKLCGSRIWCRDLGRLLVTGSRQHRAAMPAIGPLSCDGGEPDRRDRGCERYLRRRRRDGPCRGDRP